MNVEGATFPPTRPRLVPPAPKPPTGAFLCLRAHAAYIRRMDRGVTAYAASGRAWLPLRSSTPACRPAPRRHRSLTVHEIKHDGFRLQIHARKDRVRLYTMTGVDWTERYPWIVGDVARLNVRHAMLKKFDLKPHNLAQQFSPITITALERLGNPIPRSSHVFEHDLVLRVPCQLCFLTTLRGSCPRFLGVQRSGFLCHLRPPLHAMIKGEGVPAFRWNGALCAPAGIFG